MNSTISSGCGYAYLRRNAVAWAVLLGLCNLSASAHASILYAAGDGGNIYKFTPNGVSVFANLPNDSVCGLAFDNTGNLYASTSANQILRFTQNGAASIFASGGLLNSPSTLAFDNADNLYAATWGNNGATTGQQRGNNGATTGQQRGNNGASYITKFTPDGASSVYARVDNYDGFTSLVFSGSTLLASTYNNSLFIFPNGETKPGSNSGTYFGPRNTAFNTMGECYDLFRGGLVKYGDKSFLTNISAPLGLAIDMAGNLYIANTGNGAIIQPGDINIRKFSATGVDLGIFAGGFNYLTALAFTDDFGNPLKYTGTLNNDDIVGSSNTADNSIAVLNNVGNDNNGSSNNNGSDQPLALAPEPSSIWALLALCIPVVSGMIRQRLRAA